MRDDPIVITGRGRTGSRMFAAVVERLGIYFGEPGSDLVGNRHEHPELINWAWRLRVGSITREELETGMFGDLTKLFDGKPRWGVKHMYYGRMIDVWCQWFPRTQIIYLTREYIPPIGVTEEAEVAENRALMERLMGEHRQEFMAKVPAIQPVLFVSYDEFVMEPISGTQLIADFLSLPLTEDTKAWVTDYVYQHRSARYGG